MIHFLPETSSFFKKQFQKDFHLFTSNGTTSIFLALKTLDLKNKKIIMPANICFVVPFSVQLSGNDPCFVDIDHNFSIDPDEIEKSLTNEIGAIILPHMYGNMASYEKILKISQSKNIPVIEDLAQALGSSHDGKKAGSLTDISIASFGGGKILDLGFGGLLSFKDESLYSKAKKIYDSLPFSKENEAEKLHKKMIETYFQRLDNANELEKSDDTVDWSIFKTAKIYQKKFTKEYFLKLNESIQSLDLELDKRQKVHLLYKNIVINKNLKIISHQLGSTYWRQSFLVKNSHRDELMDYLATKEIRSSKYYPDVSNLFGCIGNFKKTKSMSEEIINFWPTNPVDEQFVVKLNKVVEEFFKLK